MGCSVRICSMSVSLVQQFLRRVGRRHEVLCLVRRWRLFLLIGIGVYAFALVLSRIFGLLPVAFTPLSLAILPAATLLLAWISYRRPQATDAARLADSQLATHDLFLTSSLIGSSLGSYQDLVMQAAEQKASGVLPQKVVPYH